jgi:hypothetical protein
MSDAYVIQSRGETAGIIVVERSGVRFYASASRYHALDGQRFADLRAVHRAVEAKQLAVAARSQAA